MSEDVREAFEAHPQFRYLEFDRDNDARTLLTNYYIEVVGDAPEKEQPNEL